MHRNSKNLRLKIKVLRQTEEANLIVASSYNAVVKWSLSNSLSPMIMQKPASGNKTNLALVCGNRLTLA